MDSRHAYVRAGFGNPSTSHGQDRIVHPPLPVTDIAHDIFIHPYKPVAWIYTPVRADGIGITHAVGKCADIASPGKDTPDKIIDVHDINLMVVIK